MLKYISISLRAFTFDCDHDDYHACDHANNDYHVSSNYLSSPGGMELDVAPNVGNLNLKKLGIFSRNWKLLEETAIIEILLLNRPEYREWMENIVIEEKLPFAIDLSACCCSF